MKGGRGVIHFGNESPRVLFLISNNVLRLT
jgi:hypothetical protein